MEKQEIKWVPADIKPNPIKKVIATYINGLGNRRTIMAWWLPEKLMECNCEYECNCEFDEEFDCSYLPEGWYEIVDNWHEWDFILVAEGEVTHWMPLPEAPKWIMEE